MMMFFGISNNIEKIMMCKKYFFMLFYSIVSTPNVKIYKTIAFLVW